MAHPGYSLSPMGARYEMSHVLSPLKLKRASGVLYLSNCAVNGRRTKHQVYVAVMFSQG